MQDLGRGMKERRTIDLRLRDGIGYLTLNRPEAMNALSPLMIAELGETIDELPEDLRVLVITGAGKAFCAGADITTLKPDSEGLEAFLVSVQAVFAAIRALPFPVVAGVSAVAMAGGLELAISCDFIVAARSARFGDGHANYGLLPGAGNCAILPRVAGPSIAKYLQFTGATMDAASLARTGMIAAVWEDDVFDAELEALAKRIADRAPLALRHMKRLTDACVGHSVEEVLAMEIEASRANGVTHDMREGLLAFAERRKPVFAGR